MNQCDCVRIVVRRRHVLNDTLHQLRCGVDLYKHLKVTFVGEPAVDSGGPMREYMYLLMSSIAKSHLFFNGEETKRVPMHNIVELEKNTFFYIGSIFALSLVHGGPSPSFLALSVADYIVYGVKAVQVSVDDIPVYEIKERIKLVSF